MTFPKTLLFTATPPGEGTVSEDYIRRICAALPQQNLSCFAAWPDGYGNWIPSQNLGRLPIEFAQLPKEPVNSTALGAVIGNMHSCFNRRRYWRTLRPTIDEVIDFAEAQETELIFSVLGTPSAIRMTKKIVKRLNSRLILHITEPPEVMMRNHGYDPFSYISLRKYFKHLVRNAESIIVKTEGMQKYLLKKYGVPSNVVPHPLDLRRSKRKPDTARNRVVIAYCETNGVGEELIAFLSALRMLNWTIGGKEIVLKVLGNVLNFPLYAGGPNAHLEFVGHRCVDEDTDALQDCNYAYVPSSFAKQNGLSVGTVLSEHHVLHLNAGLPILFHAPTYGAATQFNTNHKVGALCHSLDPAKVADKLQLILNDEELGRNTQHARAVCEQDKLNDGTFIQSIYRSFCVAPPITVPAIVASP